jgi:hypothetical protein
MSFMTYSLWKPWTWLSHIKQLECEIRVIDHVYKSYCENTELALDAYGYGAFSDDGASTAQSRIIALGVDRDYWKSKYQADHDKMVMLMKRAVNIQTELNEVSNKDLKNRPDTLALTKKHKELPHHFRITQMTDWMTLVEAQEKAKKIENEKQSDNSD